MSLRLQAQDPCFQPLQPGLSAQAQEHRPTVCTTEKRLASSQICLDSADLAAHAIPCNANPHASRWQLRLNPCSPSPAAQANLMQLKPRRRQRYHRTLVTRGRDGRQTAVAPPQVQARALLPADQVVLLQPRRKVRVPQKTGRNDDI